MDNSAAKKASSPQTIKCSSLSPTFEQLSHLDAEPDMQDIYAMSPNTRPSRCKGQSYTQADDTESQLRQSAASSFGPPSTASDRTWDEYIAWDSLQSPMDLQPPWLTQSPQQPSAPLFNESAGPWRQSRNSESFPPVMPGTDSRHFAPEQSLASAHFLDEDPQLGSIDAFGTYLPPTGYTYPSLLAESESKTMTGLTQDSGFASRSTSYTGRPSLEIGLRDGTLSRSHSQSSTASSTKSSSKRRQTSDAQSSDFKKPRKSKPAAHNDVEKRYRTNLNAKIAELSTSIPSLRSMAYSENVSGDEMDTDPKSGYPSKGIKKATILSRATEYIRTLEGDVQELQDENKALKKRLTLCSRIAGEEGSK